MGYSQRDAPLCGAIQLGDDERVQVEGSVELAGLGQAVLASGGVYDQHRVHGRVRALAHDAHHLLQLAHEVVGGVQAPGGVDEHQVGPGGLGALDGVVADAGRIAAALAGDHLDPGAAGPHLQLLDGRGAERVGRAQQHMAARVGRLLGYLAHGGGLAGAVDAHEQHDGLLAAEHVLAALSEGGCYLAVQGVEHGVGVGQRLARGLVAQVLHDAEGRLAAYVAQYERLLQAVPEFLVEVGPAVEQDVHRLLELVARAAQALADAIEEPHGRNAPFLGLDPCAPGQRAGLPAPRGRMPRRCGQRPGARAC